MDCKWLAKLNHEKNTDGKIDGVRKHTYNLQLDFRLIGRSRRGGLWAPRGGGGTYRIYYIFASYLKGQSPSFFPLLALFVHRAISYMKTPERTKAAFGGESARRGGGRASTAAPGPVLGVSRESSYLHLPGPGGVHSAPRPWRQCRGRKGRAGHARGAGTLISRTSSGAGAAHESPGALSWSQNPLPGRRGFVGGQWVRVCSGLAGPSCTTPRETGGKVSS